MVNAIRKKVNENVQTVIALCSNLSNWFSTGNSENGLGELEKGHGYEMY